MTNPSTGQGTFVRRKMEFTFILNNSRITNTFDEPPGADTAILSGLRASADIHFEGGIQGALNLVIYGMTQSQNNKLSTLGFEFQKYGFNALKIRAGDDIKGMSLVWSGDIREAFVSISNQQSSLSIVGVSGQSGAFQAVSPKSYIGLTAAADVIRSIAAQLDGGRGLINSGVDATLGTPYYWGSARDQLVEACRDAGCEYELTSDGQNVVIWPIGQGRTDTQVIKVNAQTGMKGYPRYNSTGITIDMVFNPLIKRGVVLDVTSILGPNASGLWYIRVVDISLETETPDGQWFMQVQCTRQFSPANLSPGEGQ